MFERLFGWQASRTRGSEKLTSLQARLHEVIAQNEEAPELERLKRSDFLLDYALRDRIKQVRLPWRAR